MYTSKAGRTQRLANTTEVDDYGEMGGPIPPAPRPRLRAEFAIGDPETGWWWRDFADQMANPTNHEPSIYHTRGPAAAALDDARNVLDTFGLAHNPHLFVRTVTIGTDGAETVSRWRLAEAEAVAR
jgi:hypothetical protein